MKRFLYENFFSICFFLSAIGISLAITDLTGSVRTAAWMIPVWFTLGALGRRLDAAS